MCILQFNPFSNKAVPLYKETLLAIIYDSGIERHIFVVSWIYSVIQPLAPNDVYICHTAQKTSRRCILSIYSTNILTEYFKHAAHSLFFPPSRCLLFQNAIYFGSFNIHILYTGCAKILKKISALKC